jgi:hypothetical protein
MAGGGSQSWRLQCTRLWKRKSREQGESWAEGGAGETRASFVGESETWLDIEEVTSQGIERQQNQSTGGSHQLVRSRTWEGKTLSPRHGELLWFIARD